MDEYILNVNEGVDTLHRKSGLTEQCNTDQAVGRQSVDAETADAMISLGQAVPCKHCKPDLAKH